MNHHQATELIRNLFTQPFDRQRYEYFLRNLLNHVEPRRGHYTGSYLPDAYKTHIHQYWRIGKYVDPTGEALDLLVVEVKTLAKLERARSTLRNFAVDRLKQFEKDAALIAFYAREDRGADWRFSFVKIEHAAYRDAKGKVRLRQELSPARRYSYLVGVHENSHTAAKQLLPLLTRDQADPSIEEIEAAFSVERVSDEFFAQYRQLFLNLAAHLKAQPFFQRDTAEATDRAVSRFAKKLLGQIVFLYFLQKKGWLGVPRGGQWGQGSKRFLRERFDRMPAGANYFRDFLHYLFYEALAQAREGEEPDFYARFDCKIPFLNGGLFEAEYDWRRAALDLPNELFHNREKNPAGDQGTGILDVFDRYNFTVKEDEPLEKEVAIDPEMLGKVFENLLEVTERKRKGAFYTPRPIVHYLCQESLIHYLDRALNADADSVPREDLALLIRKGHLMGENDQRVLRAGRETKTYRFQLPESVRTHARAIDAALADIKICDPAIGSGAFPVGLLHEIVRARQVLVPHSGNEQCAYALKRHAIQASLYGVDIDASAIDIARLRLWLSMIVEEERYDHIEPLPNLDYKIVQGDSLIGIQVDLFNQQLFSALEAKKQAFFSATHPEEKQRLHEQIEGLIAEITDGRKRFDFQVYFSEVWHRPEGNGGFDVVIGNPPYLRIQGIRQSNPEKADFYKKHYVSATGSFDLYVIFMERGLQLLKKGGILNYITPDKWVHASFGKGIRSLVVKNRNVHRLISFGSHQVFSACTYSSLVWMGTQPKPCMLYDRVEPPEGSTVSLIEALENIKFSEIPYARLSSDPWILTSRSSTKVMNAILHYKRRLDSSLHMFVGLQTSKDSVYFLKEAVDRGDCFSALSPELGERIEIERGLVKPLLLGDQVHRYRKLETNNLVVFPYNLPSKARGKATLMSEAQIRKNYPKGWEYLKRCESVLRGRERGRFNTIEWYKFGRKQGIDDGGIPKLLGPDISLGGNFSIDYVGKYYTTTTLYSYIKKSEVWESYEYWMALLNSSVLWFYLKNSGGALANGYSRYKPAYLKKFPIPSVSMEQEKIISALARLAMLAYSEVDENIVISFLENLIDACVMECYFPAHMREKQLLFHAELRPLLAAYDPEASQREQRAFLDHFHQIANAPDHPIRNRLLRLDTDSPDLLALIRNYGR